MAKFVSGQQKSLVSAFFPISGGEKTLELETMFSLTFHLADCGRNSLASKVFGEGGDFVFYF